MRVGVLGGGFGLYGWLPAAALVPGATVTTLARYESRIRDRPELSHLLARVSFVEELEDLLGVSDCLVSARRPGDQAHVIAEVSRRSWRGCLVLEKPLAPDPTRARTLVDALSESNVQIGTGFLMDRTNWGLALADSLAVDRPTHVEITWRFLAHHYRHSLNNWKSRPSDGGGALRFFAIHLIALLARFGEWKVLECTGRAGEIDDPAVSFAVSRGSTEIHVRCDSRWPGDPEFTLAVARGEKPLWSRSLSDPFVDSADSHEAAADRRISFLAAVLRDLAARGGEAPSALVPHVSLWGQIEAIRNRS